MGRDFAMTLANRSDYYATYSSILGEAVIEYDGAPEITPCGEIKVKISITPKLASQKVFDVQWVTPEGFTVDGRLNLNAMHRGWQKTPAVSEYTIHVPEKIAAKNSLYAIITCEGHFDVMTIPVTLLG